MQAGPTPGPQFPLLPSIACALLLTTAPATQSRTPFWDHLSRATDLITARGSRLMLLLLDVNGDGRPDIFIAPESLCGSGGCEWSIYSPTGRPKEVRYLGQAVFDAGAFRFEPRTRTLTFCRHLSADACALGEYTFGGSSATLRERGECKSGSVACEGELRSFRDWQTVNRPALFNATIDGADILTGLRWRPERANAAAGVPDLDRLFVVGRTI